MQTRRVQLHAPHLTHTLARTVCVCALSLLGVRGDEATAQLEIPASAGSQLRGTHHAVWLQNAVEPTKEPAERAKSLTSLLSLEEKISLVHGNGMHTGTDGYVGESPAIERLGIPALTLEDGPQGVADQVTGVTAFPSALTVAATWDVDLMGKFATAMAQEQKGKGANVLLGPMVNIARVPNGGRNFESFGEDPYLSSQLAISYVKGVQSQGVMACVKHFVNNNQERDRMTVSATVPERAMWEIYYPAFKAAVDAGVVSAMCAYNKVNGTYACENEVTINQDLKGRMGFRGFLVSDWWATHSTVESAKAGLDMEQPFGYNFGDNLKRAVQDGSVPQSRVDDMVQRLLWAMSTVGIIDSKREAWGRLNEKVNTEEHGQLARDLAAAGTVLLKNDDKVLPLPNSIKSIAVIGDAASEAPVVTGGGSGYVIPPYVVKPLDAIRNKAQTTGASVSYSLTNDTTGAKQAAAQSDVAVIFVATNAKEGEDRNGLWLGDVQDQLIYSVASVQPRTIVVVHGPGAVTMPWATNVKSVLMAFLPGQADGDAITDVLFGTVNPSGRLPVTFPNKDGETWLQTEEQYPGINLNAVYTEELLVGYRYYDAKGLSPLFPFGHGLSYTTFDYKNLTVTLGGSATTSIDAHTTPSKDTQTYTDGDMATSTHTLSFSVTNNGSLAGSEIPQLYLSYPEEAQEPPKQLRGFIKVPHLTPGETREVTFTVRADDRRVWSVESDGWVYPTGTFSVHVGSSSKDIRLSGAFTV